MPFLSKITINAEDCWVAGRIKGGGFCLYRILRIYSMRSGKFKSSWISHVFLSPCNIFKHALSWNILMLINRFFLKKSKQLFAYQVEDTVAKFHQMTYFSQPRFRWIPESLQILIHPQGLSVFGGMLQKLLWIVLEWAQYFPTHATKWNI